MEKIEKVFSRARIVLDRILEDRRVEPYFYDIVDSKGWNDGDILLLCDIPLTGDYMDLANLERDLSAFEYEENAMKSEYDVLVYKAPSDIMVKVRIRGGNNGRI